MTHLYVIFALVLLFAVAASAQEQYPLTPDHERQPNVPIGTVTQHTWTSNVFPGAVRDYWVYVPEQYKPEVPARVMIFQDGGGFVSEGSRWRAPIVFDNLIAKGELPVIIGLFVNPGTLPPAAEGQWPRPDRCFEYDSVNDRYARFLLEELLPEVARDYNLSTDPNDRALCGASSGGICSFTAAWFRPDAFRRVLSFVGSYSNLRGGDAYLSLIRKTEPKPLRLFLQSGKHDMNTYAGSWYINNQAMQDSLRYMGYDAQVVLGEAGHDDRQGGSIFPDALRWLWRDWDVPLTPPTPPADREWATDIVTSDKPWEAVPLDIALKPGLATDAAGNLIVRSVEGKPLCLSHEGTTLSAPDELGLVSKALERGADLGQVARTKEGGAFYTDPARHCVCYISPSGEDKVVFRGITNPTGLVFLPDHSLLAVADSAARWGWSFRAQPDGSLVDGVAFYRLEITDDSSVTDAAGITVDSNGYVYFATDLGIQVCDQDAHTALIIASPPGGQAEGLTFAGPDFKTLYATVGGKLYRRPTLHQGVQPL
jgi:enterochelin esterase-like enzyme/sugar lactone lactonase YvrE